MLRTMRFAYRGNRNSNCSFSHPVCYSKRRSVRNMRPVVWCVTPCASSLGTEKSQASHFAKDAKKHISTKSLGCVMGKLGGRSLVHMELKKMDSLPKFEEMTDEMFAYYFPETWHDPNNPKFWPYIPEEQPSNPDFDYLK